MNRPTYKEQFDKITRAYIENKLDPYNGCACFIGNLLNNTSSWGNYRCYFPGGKSLTYRDEVICGYNMVDITDMENNFLRTIEHKTCTRPLYAGGTLEVTHHDNYENALFEAMESTLDILKQIHIRDGEIIDETPEFKKRQLSDVTTA